MGLSLTTLQQLEVEVGADVDPAERELRDFTRRAGDGGGGIFGGLATAGVAAFAAIGAGAAALGGWGLNVAMDAETAAISFETLLGSGEAAQAMLADLEAFAARTPFEFPELRDAASRLVAVGTATEDVIPLMSALGDATAGMGTGAEGINRAVTALTQMQQKGRVQAQEMLQLTEAGIPAWDALASVLGTDVAGAVDLVSTGTVEAATLFEALEGRAGPAMQRLTGLMDAQSQTLGGMLSTLKDTVGLALADAMAPVVDSLSAALPGITTLIGDTLTQLGPSIGTLATGLVDLLGGLLPALAPIIGVVADVAGAFLSTLGPVLETLAPPLGLIASTLGGALVGALETIAPALPPLAAGFATLLSALVAPGADFLGQLAPLFSRLITAVTPLLGPLSELAITLLDALIPAVMPLLPPIISLIEALVGTEESAGPLITIVEMLSSVIAAIPTPVLSALVVALVALSNPIAGLALAASFLVANWDGIAEFFVGLWESIIGAFVSAWDWVAGFLAALPGNILGFFLDAPDLLRGVGFDLLAGLLNGAIDLTGALWDFWTSLPQTVLDALGDLGGLLFNVGGDILNGLWNGLVAGAGWFRDGLLGFLRDILPGPVERFLGISSPSRMATWWGEMVGEGLANGLAGQAATVAGAANDLATAAVPDLSPIAIGGATLAGQLSPLPYSLAATGGSQAPAVIDVTLTIDGERVAQVLVDPLRGELVETGAANGTSGVG